MAQQCLCHKEVRTAANMQVSDVVRAVRGMRHKIVELDTHASRIVFLLSKRVLAVLETDVFPFLPPSRTSKIHYAVYTSRNARCDQKLSLTEFTSEEL